MSPIIEAVVQVQGYRRYIQRWRPRFDGDRVPVTAVRSRHPLVQSWIHSMKERVELLRVMTGYSVMEYVTMSAAGGYIVQQKNRAFCRRANKSRVSITKCYQYQSVVRGGTLRPRLSQRSIEEVRGGSNQHGYASSSCGIAEFSSSSLSSST